MIKYSKSNRVLQTINKSVIQLGITLEQSKISNIQTTLGINKKM